VKTVRVERVFRDRITIGRAVFGPRSVRHAGGAGC
jgi:hypothetical protein